jgi:hypothetical protein
MTRNHQNRQPIRVTNRGESVQPADAAGSLTRMTRDQFAKRAPGGEAINDRPALADLGNT